MGNFGIIPAKGECGISGEEHGAEPCKRRPCLAGVASRLCLPGANNEKPYLDSDVGLSVGDTCECHYASVVITPECAEAQLYEYSAKGGGRVILGTIKFDKNILLNDKRVNKKYLKFK